MPNTFLCHRRSIGRHTASSRANALRRTGCQPDAADGAGRPERLRDRDALQDSIAGVGQSTMDAGDISIGFPAAPRLIRPRLTGVPGACLFILAFNGVVASAASPPRDARPAASLPLASTSFAASIAAATDRPGEDGEARHAEAPVASPTGEAALRDSVSVLQLASGLVEWDQHNDLFLIKNEAVKRSVLDDIASYLLGAGDLSPDEAARLTFDLQRQARGKDLVLAPITERVDSARPKRISVSESDRLIAEHIARNCAFEDEILDPNQRPPADILLFRAQRWENPFRMIYDKTNGRPRPEARGLANGLNIVTDILTIGIKPLVTSLIANSLRRSYYLGRHDGVCAERFRQINTATILTGIDDSGLSYVSSASRGGGWRRRITSMLESVHLSRPRGVRGDRPSGMRRGVLRSAQGVPERVSDGGVEMTLHAHADGTFIARPANAGTGRAFERRVIIADQENAWRYADDFDLTDLGLQVIAGRPHVWIDGEQFAIHKNQRDGYEIVIALDSGAQRYEPVYMEPITRVWHVGSVDGNPVFTVAQREAIRKSAVTVDRTVTYDARLNRVPDRYGSGRIIEVRAAGEPMSAPPSQKLIELNGSLVPVVEQVVPGHGLVIAIREPTDSARLLPLEWDGRRWLLEPESSPSLAQSVTPLITPDMYSTRIDSSKVSTPDRVGLQWDEFDVPHLRHNGKYIEVVTVADDKIVVPRHEERARVVLTRDRTGVYGRRRLDDAAKRQVKTALRDRGTWREPFEFELDGRLITVGNYAGLRAANAFRFKFFDMLLDALSQLVRGIHDKVRTMTPEAIVEDMAAKFNLRVTTTEAATVKQHLTGLRDVVMRYGDDRSKFRFYSKHDAEPGVWAQHQTASGVILINDHWFEGHAPQSMFTLLHEMTHATKSKDNYYLSKHVAAVMPDGEVTQRVFSDGPLTSAIDYYGQVLSHQLATRSAISEGTISPGADYASPAVSAAHASIPFERRPEFDRLAADNADTLTLYGLSLFDRSGPLARQLDARAQGIHELLTYDGIRRPFQRTPPRAAAGPAVPGNR